MKISKNLLNKVIDEEYSRAISRREMNSLALSESTNSESFVIHRLSSVDADDLVEFANRWAKTGSQVQENVQQMLTGDFDDLNPAAIHEARRLLEGFHPDLDEAFSEYEKHISWDE